MNRELRHQFYLLASGLLYLGPLLAGLSGHPALTVCGFLGIFMVWLLLMQPGALPQDPHDWLNGMTMGMLVLRMAVQLGLIVFCFAVGRGIGAVASQTTAIPVWVPLAMSAASIIYARVAAADDPVVFTSSLREAAEALDAKAEARRAGENPDLTRTERQALRQAARMAAEHEVARFEEPLEQGLADDLDLEAMVTRLAQLDDQSAALMLLAERASEHGSHPWWFVALLRLAGHPMFDRTFVPPEIMADWCLEALTRDEPALTDAALSALSHWADGGGFGDRRDVLLDTLRTFRATLPETAPQGLRGQLTALVLTLEGQPA